MQVTIALPKHLWEDDHIQVMRANRKASHWISETLAAAKRKSARALRVLRTARPDDEILAMVIAHNDCEDVHAPVGMQRALAIVATDYARFGPCWVELRPDG